MGRTAHHARIAVPIAALAGGFLAVALLSPARSAPPLATGSGVAPVNRPLRTTSSSGSKLAGLTLEQLQKAFRASPGEGRQMASRLLEASSGDAEQLHEWLHRRTGVAAEDFKSVLRAVGASVPNRQGRFNSAEKEIDWLDQLLVLPSNKLGAGALERARTEAALSVALLRGLARSRHPEASLSLLRFAYRHQGAFRDEAGRQIRALGPHAVPGLLRAQALKDPEAHRMVRYASYQLDRIDCARPDRALKQADPDLRVEILHAYGETRSSVAVAGVLSYCNDPVESVRRAARWAMLRYVSGRPPKVVKRKLKLPGGKETDQERALYLTYRQLASHALLARLAEELSGSKDGPKHEAQRRTLAEEAEPRYLAERLFARFDEKREAQQRQELQIALELGRQGKLDSALARFDRILAADPYHGQREAMAPLYFRKGRELLAAGRLAAAQAYLTKATHLAPAAAFVSEARARRALAEVLQEPEMTSASEWKLRTALRLFPSLDPARRALEAYEKRQQQRLWLVGGVGGGLALGLIFGLALLRRRLSW